MNIIKKEVELIENCMCKALSKDNILLEDICKFLYMPSKRIRSKLALLFIKSFGSEITQDIIELLAAGELIHNASLLHDDVIDNADTRRGSATLAKMYSDKMSVISGDLLISAAIKKILALCNSDISKLFLECTENMCNAEIRQYLLRGKNPAEKEYLQICEAKTASLFQAILKSSAIMCGLNTEYADKLAKSYGIVFQIRNDLEPLSLKNDKFNNLKTAADIMSIEKTNSLIDNYKEEMRSIVAKFPQNVYSTALEDLINNL